MFPLGGVLLPGAYLPLHVFEPRYRELVRACLAGTPEFGVVLIERGSEVGGGDVRFDVACVARIVEAVALNDGRYALGTVGARRVRVERWLPNAPYPCAEVSDWPDTPAGERATASRDGLVRSLRRVLALAAEAGDETAPATVSIDEDPVVAGWQIAALAPFGPLDRQALLAAPDPDDRAGRLASALAAAESMLAARVVGG